MDVAVRVGDLDVVVDELVLNSRDGGVVQIRNHVGQDEKIDVAVAGHVPCRNVRHVHVQGNPIADPRPSGVGVVVGVSQRVDAIGVHAVLDLCRGHTIDVVREGPNRKIAGIHVLLVPVMGPESNPARIPRVALGHEHRWRRVVHAG